MKAVQDSSDLTSRGASLASRIECANSRSRKTRAGILAKQSRYPDSSRSGAAQNTFAHLKNPARNSFPGTPHANGKFKTQEQSYQKAERARDESLRSLTQMKSKLQSLQELAEAYEGFADGPKAALEFVKADSPKADPFRLLPTRSKWTPRSKPLSAAGSRTVSKT